MTGLVCCCLFVLAIEIAARVLSRRKPKPRTESKPGDWVRADGPEWVAWPPRASTQTDIQRARDRAPWVLRSRAGRWRI